MKFGEQPTYSRQAYEDTEKGIQDVKDAAKGSGSVEELRALASEKNALETQKADLHGRAFDEATKMDQERDALVQERVAQEKTDAAEADRLRAEILGEAPVSEVASVKTESEMVQSVVEMAPTTSPEQPIAASEQDESVPKTEAPRRFFDKVKSFFSGEREETSKESLVDGLKDFLGKPKENGEYKDMVDGQGNFDIRSAYGNIKSKKWRQEKFEKAVAFAGATATLLSGSGLLAGGLAGVGVEGGAATIAATSPFIGAAMSGALYAVPAVGLGAAAAWGGVKLWNMYKRRKALRAADELFIREHGNDSKDAWNKGTLQGLRSDYGL